MEKPAISEDIKTLADAYTLNSKASNRAWAISSTLTVLALGNLASDPASPVDLLTAHLDRATFYVICFLFLVSINVVYASAHSQAYLSGDIYGKYLSQIDAFSIDLLGRVPQDRRYSLGSVAHTLYWPNLNRIFPISHSFGAKSVFHLIFAYAKCVIDLVYVLWPLVGVASCLTVLVQPHVTNWSLGGVVLSAVMIVVAAISSVPTWFLARTAYGWDMGAIRRLRGD